MLKIRAFVAGSGDVRRVRDLVSEEFTERKPPLPALTLLRAGHAHGNLLLQWLGSRAGCAAQIAALRLS